MAWGVTENNWDSRKFIFNGINDAFEGTITTVKPQPVAYCIRFFSMSYRNVMNQNINNNSNTFQKPYTQNEQVLLGPNTGHHWKR